MAFLGGFVNELGMGGAAESQSVEALFESMGHSALLGLCLMLLTAWVSSSSVMKKLTAVSSLDESAVNKAPVAPPSAADLIFSSANVLYLCFGMTGMMLIVNNNIARAFAIAAAIALVRFRIKVDSKILSMSLFYGVLTGMACGVGHVFVAYMLVLFFGVLQFVVLSTAKLAESKKSVVAATLSAGDDIAVSGVLASEITPSISEGIAANASSVLSSSQSPVVDRQWS